MSYRCGIEVVVVNLQKIFFRIIEYIQKPTLLTMYVFAFVLSFLASSILADDYYHSLYLDFNKTYQLSWKFNSSHIEFHTEVKTLGYVALGLSLDGTLKNADVFIAGVSNGQSYSSVSQMILHKTIFFRLLYYKCFDLSLINLLSFCFFLFLQVLLFG